MIRPPPQTGSRGWLITDAVRNPAHDRIETIHDPRHRQLVPVTVFGVRPLADEVRRFGN